MNEMAHKYKKRICLYFKFLFWRENTEFPDKFKLGSVALSLYSTPAFLPPKIRGHTNDTMAQFIGSVLPPRFNLAPVHTHIRFRRSRKLDRRHRRHFCYLRGNDRRIFVKLYSKRQSHSALGSTAVGKKRFALFVPQAVRRYDDELGIHSRLCARWRGNRRGRK